MKIVHIFRKKKGGNVYFTIGDKVFVSPNTGEPYDSPMLDIAHDLVRRQIKGESLLVTFETPEGIEGVNITEGQKKDFHHYWRTKVEIFKETSDLTYHFKDTKCRRYKGKL